MTSNTKMMDNKSRIRVDAILPRVHDSDDQCMNRFIDMVTAKHGIEKVHVVAIRGDLPLDHEPASFCIHFNPHVISLAEVREFAHRAGVELDGRYGHWQRNVDPMHTRRASAIESRLTRISGVIETVVSPNGAVRVEFDRQITDESAISQALDEWTQQSLKNPTITPVINKTKMGTRTITIMPITLTEASSIPSRN